MRFGDEDDVACVRKLAQLAKRINANSGGAPPAARGDAQPIRAFNGSRQSPVLHRAVIIRAMRRTD